MKRIFQYAAALLFLAPVLQSCGDDTVTPTGETKITFDQNAEAKFAYSRLDTTDGRENQPMDEGRDTVLQTTVMTNHTYKGKTNVIFKENRYIVGGEQDSSYYWQDGGNGDLYQHNFGLDLINSPSVQAVINQPVEADWVIIAKMGESSGHAWLALQDTIVLNNLGSLQVVVTDNAVVNDDVTMVIDGKSTTVKRFTHKISAKNALLGEVANTEIEVYVSRDHGGVVKTVRKISNIKLQSPATQAIGADLNLIEYTK